MGKRATYDKTGPNSANTSTTPSSPPQYSTPEEVELKLTTTATSSPKDTPLLNGNGNSSRHSQGKDRSSEKTTTQNIRERDNREDVARQHPERGEEEEEEEEGKEDAVVVIEESASAKQRDDGGDDGGGDDDDSDCETPSASAVKTSLLPPSSSADDDDDDAEQKDEEKEDKETSAVPATHPGLPVDRGWAWVIMFMQFSTTFLLVGYGRALSIFFLEFRRMFDVPVTAATIVFGVLTAAFGFGNMLVSHVLLSRFTVRRLVLTGTVINAVTIGLSALAPNLIYLTVMHCFIGFSHALVFVPGTTLVGHYFHKRRSTALSVANAGLSASALVFPPLTQWLITHYGTRGALLITSGIQLQAVVAGCLMRPVSWYTGSSRGTKQQQGQGLKAGPPQKDAGLAPQDSNALQLKDAAEWKDSEKKCSSHHVNELKVQTVGKSSTRRDDRCGSHDGGGGGDGGDNESTSATTTTRLLEEFVSEHKGRRLDGHPNHHPHHHPHHPHHPHLHPPAYHRFLSSPLSSSVPDSFLASRSEVRCSSEEAFKEDEMGHHLSSSGRRPYVRELSHPASSSLSAAAAPHPSHHHLIVHYDITRSDSRRSGYSALASSLMDVCGSTVSVSVDASKDLRKREGERENADMGGEVCADDQMRPRKARGCWKRCASVLSVIIDVSLFKNWLFLLILFYVPLGFSGGFIGFYFPSLGVEKGLSRADAALLMTVAGGVDLVSRVCVGYLADKELVKRTHLVAGCLTFMGLACQFCRFYSGFGLLAMFAVIYGLIGGVCNNLFAVVIIDLLGLPLLGKIMGLVMVFNAAFTSVNHILIGALVDMTGSFLIPYHYVGGSLFLSALILLMEPLARRLEDTRQLRMKAAEDSGRETGDV